MILEHLSILNYKNIAEAELDFCPGVNCMLGSNGMGKSNLLEAIHYLSMIRPMRTVLDRELVRHGAESLMVKGTYAPEHAEASANVVSVGIVPGKAKRLKVNNKEYNRLSEHIGRFPVVTVSPDDSDLIRNGGAERRKLADMVISQADPTYLPHLISYSKGLEVRNRMLRQGVKDRLLYESIEHGMIESAQKIHERRAAWVDEMSPLFEEHYHAVSGGKEQASIRYQSHLSESPLEELLEGTRQKDSILGHTTMGVHRDDLLMYLGDGDMRRLGSQGQMKTYTIALRLAIFDYIRRHTLKTPILLLDDIFDKLDAERVSRIIELVSGSGNYGQIFITDTNRRHLDDMVAHLSGEHRLFEVKAGEFSLI